MAQMVCKDQILGRFLFICCPYCIFRITLVNICNVWYNRGTKGVGRTCILRSWTMNQAFRYKALGFVRKQFLEGELPYALSTIMSELHKKDDMDDRIEITETRSEGGHTYRLCVNSIMYIQNFRHNVTIHMCDGSAITVRSSLSYFSEHACFRYFAAISAGIIVNLALVELTRDAVCFSSGELLHISRRRISSVRAAYQEYIKEAMIRSQS